MFLEKSCAQHSLMDAGDRSCSWHWKRNIDPSDEEDKKNKRKRPVARSTVCPVAKDTAEVPEADPERGGGG